MQLQLFGKKIWVFHQSVDFRMSMDGLSAFIVNNIKQNPQSGIFFVLQSWS